MGETSEAEIDSLRLASGLRRAYREATLQLARAVSDHELSQLEYHLLLDLAGAGDGLSQSQLADHLQAPKTRVSILVRGLERRSLVEPFRPEQDRRLVRVRLTAAGAARLEAAQRAVRLALIEFARGIPRERLVQLLETALRSYLGIDVTITVGQEPPEPPLPPASPHSGRRAPARAAPASGQA